MPPYRPLADRFWDKVDRTGDCWVWTAAKNGYGYGVIGVGARATDKAHRVSYRLHYGDIPDGMCVCHRCDNPSCVRPDHLFIGTLSDNAQDMVAKGRDYRPDNRGERAQWHKLTESDVRDILTKRMNASDFARLYNVSRSAVRRIYEGRNWKHLND